SLRQPIPLDLVRIGLHQHVVALVADLGRFALADHTVGGIRALELHLASGGEREALFCAPLRLQFRHFFSFVDCSPKGAVRWLGMPLLGRNPASPPEGRAYTRDAGGEQAQPLLGNGAKRSRSSTRSARSATLTFGSRTVRYPSFG